MISFYEIGYLRIPATQLLKIAAALNVSLREIERMNGASGNRSVSRKIARLVEKVKTLPRRKQNQIAEYVEFLAKTGT